MPIEDFEWQIGVIVGRSGSGKTSIAKHLFPDAYIRGFDYSGKCVLEDFPEGLETTEITKALCSVGFASPPDWVKSYDCLSQGEKMRTDIARALCLDKDVVVFDEFTSVIDREIAKIASLAINKAVRKQNKKFVAVSCHYDILDWLEPDWVYYPESNIFEDCTGILAESTLPSGTKVVARKKGSTQSLCYRFTEFQGICGEPLGTITI